jgi:phosphoribosylformimino-5-aminoimidazole carboxamide ribotide isomerase
MQVIPSLDLQSGRSRLVWWPGASSGTGIPTDRPAAIAEALVAQGAPLVHLVDLDGAGKGRPTNLDAIGAVARAVARPLQLAGGVDGPEQIEIAYAAGATRVVVPAWAVAEDGTTLAECLAVGGDWMAVGMDARPESLRAYPWRHRAVPRLEELVVELHGAGVRRFVFSHVTPGDTTAGIGRIADGLDAEVLVAGGVASLDELRGLRDTGVDAVILGEVLFTGAIDLATALRELD